MSRIAPPAAPRLAELPKRRLAGMLEAGEAVAAARDRLLDRGSNVVAELLAGQGPFYEFDHYPDGDVFDPVTGAQYYYHAHRSVAGEHGHFHTFLRRAAAGSPTHLIAVSMDEYGEPRALFAVNRWVTDEAWVPAATAIRLLPRFAVTTALPEPAVNAWITGLLRLFRPEVEALLLHRDRAIEARAGARERALEDKGLETTGRLPIDVDERLAALRRLTRGETRAANPPARSFRKG
ncbi:DUF6969 family protein [Desertibaculum subflavum]|uniref:DUF6969 family protein n=1 Tax=Desertibaculum subflavum TaxID=2268458 RepID=UPI000E667CD9